jgi:tRNA 2-thiouridine synthesizing protein A
MLKLKEIDARGISCPQPVLMTKKALVENPEGIVVLVDNNTAKSNVMRFAQNSGYTAKVREENEEFVITIAK